MARDGIVEAAKAGASFGFKKGFEEATDAIRGLVAGADSHEARQYAELMVKCLEAAADAAHREFMEEAAFALASMSKAPGSVQ